MSWQSQSKEDEGKPPEPLGTVDQEEGIFQITSVTTVTRWGICGDNAPNLKHHFKVSVEHEADRQEEDSPPEEAGSDRILGPAGLALSLAGHRAKA